MTTPDLSEREQIVAMSRTEPVAQQRMMADFLRPRLTEFRRMAPSLCRRASLPVARYFDEVESIILEEASALLSQLMTEPMLLPSNVPFVVHVRSLSRRSVREYADGAASGMNLSGAVSVARKRRELRSARDSLVRELGRNPTPDEIVAEANRHLSYLKDQARQGMVLTKADLMADPSVYGIDQDQDPVLWEIADPAPGPDYDDGAPIDRFQGRRAVDHVMKVAALYSPEAERVAKAWLGDLFTDGTVRSGAEIAAKLGMSTSSVSRYLVRLRADCASWLMSVSAELADRAFGAEDQDGDADDQDQEWGVLLSEPPGNTDVVAVSGSAAEAARWGQAVVRSRPGVEFEVMVRDGDMWRSHSGLTPVQVRERTWDARCPR